VANKMYTIHWNPKVLRTMGGLGRLCLKAICDEMVFVAMKNAPYRTGNLRRTLDKDILADTSAEVFSTSGYGGYVEFGTGLFGPHHQRIYPTTKKALSWFSGGMRVAYRSTAGMKAQPFMEPAVDDVDRRAGSIIAKEFREAAA